MLIASGGPAWAATTVTQVPVPATTFGIFTSVDAVSATDGWAVGGAVGGGNGAVQRFDGTRWRVVPSPDLLAGAPTAGPG